MFDVLIVGGGMVGASMAVALAPLGLRVGMIEAFAFENSRSQPSYDDRSVALSYGSRLIFQGMGLWEALAPQSESIAMIHVSDKGHFGATRLYAEKEKVPALGYVIESRVLGGVLYSALRESNVDVIAPASVHHVEQSPEEGIVKVYADKSGNSACYECRLLIIADGANSKIRTQVGINVNERDYQQSALIANVTTSKPHHNAAYERFTPSGPLALLPLRDNRYSLVWTHKSCEIDEVLALDDVAFLKRLQATFGYRQGAFIKAGQRSAYPLKRVKSDTESAGRALVMGNASHAIHPVAGQGLNLAMRDVAVLADLLAKAVNDQGDIGSADLLAEYEARRRPDHQSVVNYTDGLVRVFSNDFGLLGHLRAGGLLAVDRINPARQLLARQSMGLRFRQERLSRGLSLR